MITIVIGHRGVGKSTFLRRLQNYLGNAVQTFDLDGEIEKRENRTLDSIFTHQGEAAFRELELHHFHELFNRSQFDTRPTWITVGAGFPIEAIPDTAHVLWIRRATDSVGRVFLDRPRLNQNLSPLEEYQERYRDRQRKFQSRSNQVLWIPEGWDFLNSAEKHYFSNGSTLPISGYKTLRPKDIPQIDRLIQLGIQNFELRTDLLSHNEILTITRQHPNSHFLLSIRGKAPSFLELSVDWPLESGAIPANLSPTVISLHEISATGEPTLETLTHLSENYPKAILKYCPEIGTFSELLDGHRWAMIDPICRSFLPRSPKLWAQPTGKWAWYRLITKDLFPIQFFNEGDDEVMDQPLLLDWMRVGPSPKHFAAVIGDPVFHSRTPSVHFEFFNQNDQNCPVVSVPVTENEFERALSVLQQLGLRFAAVTSPLKLKAAGLCEIDQGGINTLTWNSKTQKWDGTNTDTLGFKNALTKLLSKNQGKLDLNSIAVWGGGGVLESIRATLPDVAYCSSRDPHPTLLPRTVVWAAPRRMEQNWPPEQWKPATVVDLNYSENSPGRDYAMRVGATYFSGLEFFREQAILQQEFWRPYV